MADNSLPAEDSLPAALLLVEACVARSLCIALAESCTAGLAADLIARVPGASRVFWGSFVTYTEEAKAAMLGLDLQSIRKNGAASRETALAMAEGALAKSGVHASAAVTGIAGPGGDGSGVPVGTVWIATAFRGGRTEAAVFHFEGTRGDIRRASAEKTIEALFRRVEGPHVLDNDVHKNYY
jgi:PncC family amidohydrolase